VRELTLRHYKTGLDELFVARWFRSKRIEAGQMTSVLLLTPGSVCPKCARDVADATFSCQRKFVCPGCRAAGRGGKHDGILYVKDEDFSIMFANVPVWRQLAFINEHNILAPTVRLLRQNLG
jgi:hypothetical protein